MNPFSKNPFTKQNQPHIVGKNINIDENKKIENIKEKMMKLKYDREERVSIENNQSNIKERIDNLKNIDKWK